MAEHRKTGPRPFPVPRVARDGGPWDKTDGPRAGGTASWANLRPKDHMPTLLDPSSPGAERYHMLSVHLKRMVGEDGHAPQVIGVTSALPREGKTCTAMNLAIATAQESDGDVLLLECDFRRPRMKHLLVNPPSVGLRDVLEGKRSIERVVLKMDKPANLSVVLAGRAIASPVALFRADAVTEAMRWTRSNFETIIIDTPPALDLPDATRLGNFVDTFLLVVWSGRTRRDALAKTHRLLSRYGVAGVVLNGVPRGHGDGAYYSYQYHKD